MSEDSLDFIIKRLTAAMDFRSLDFDELFSLSDMDDDNFVTIGELISVFERLNLGLSRKELGAIKTIFETGGQDGVSREEFVILMERMKLGLKKPKVSVMTPFLSPPVPPPVRKPHKIIGKAGAEQTIATIIHTMESQGTSIIEVVDKLEISPKEKVSLMALANALGESFPHVANEDVMKLLSFLELDKNYQINAFETFEFFSAYSKLITFSLKITFRNIAKSIQMKGLDTNAFFILNNLRESMPIGTFVMRMCPLFELSQDQSIAIFTSLDIEKRGIIDIGQLITVIDSYRTDDVSENLFQHEEQTGTEAMGASSVSKLGPKDFVKALAEYKLTPQHVFQLADPKNIGKANVFELKKAVLKLMPLFPADDLAAFLRLIPQMDISIEDFLLLFPIQGERPRPKLAESDPLDLTYTDHNGLRVDQVYWIKKMDDAALLNSIALNTLFSAADMNKDDSVTLQELGGMLKKCIAQKEMTHADVASVMSALDINGNGKIERQEFLTRIIQCRNTDTDPRLLAKYEQDILKPAKSAPNPVSPLPLLSTSLKAANISSQATVVFDRHIKPLCIKASSLYNSDIGGLFLKLKSSLPPDLSTSLYINLPAESLINIYRFKRMFKLPKGLIDSECEIVFGLTDTHSRDSFYLYHLLTTLDSMENDFSMMPFPWNEKAEQGARGLWSEVVRNMKGKIAIHLAFGTNMRALLSDSEWDSIIFGAGLPPQHKIMLKESLKSIPSLKVYHIAALIQSYLPLYVLDVEQIIHEGLSSLEGDLAEVLAARGHSPTDKLVKEKIMEELCTVMVLSAIEASLVIKLLYDEEKTKPLYHLYTYVDMIRSTYDNAHAIVYEVPNPPFAQALYLESGASELFRTLSFAFKTSITDYGVQVTDWLDEVSFVNVLNRATGVAPDDLRDAFRLIKFNKWPSVRAYHLLAVLDSYKAQSVIFSYPTPALSKLYAQIPKTHTGITWIKSRSQVDFDSPQNRQDIATIFKLTPEESEGLFIYLDSQNRGGVYLYQIATMIDLYISTGSSIGTFPIIQNPHTAQSTRSILNTIAVNLDEQGMSAYRYYIDNGVELEEACDKKLFARRLGAELTAKESEELFVALEMRKMGFVRMYHLIACLETYCKRRIEMELTPDGR